MQKTLPSSLTAKTGGSFVMASMLAPKMALARGASAAVPASLDAQQRNTVQQAPGGRVSAGCKESTRQECPHCETPCLIRSSQKMSKLTRELIYWCTNPECGHTFVALMEVVRTLSPSATPDPCVSLPLSSHIRREMLQTQLEHAGIAAHEARFTRPVTGDLFADGGSPPE